MSCGVGHTYGSDPELCGVSVTVGQAGSCHSDMMQAQPEKKKKEAGMDEMTCLCVSSCVRLH